MMTLIRKYPIASYFTLVFLLSWGGVLVVIGGPGSIPATPEETTRLFPLGLTTMLAGPIISGLLLTGLVDGRAGYRELFSRLLRWRVGVRWYAGALLFIPAITAAILFGLSFASPTFLPDIATVDDPGSLVITGLFMGILAGLFEETGWSGFAAPRLLTRYGVGSTGIIIGFLWGLWHFLATFWASGDASGAMSSALLFPPLLFYVAVLPAYRVLMVWALDRTGSLLIVMLMHMSLTASTLFIFKPAATGGELAIYYLLLGVVILGAVAIIRRWGFARQPLPRGAH